MEWKVFDENDLSTYPPVNEAVLISFNTTNYSDKADGTALGYLKKISPNNENSGLYWYVEYSTPNTLGISPLENSVEPFGLYSQVSFYVTAWSYFPKPYNK